MLSRQRFACCYTNLYLCYIFFVDNITSGDDRHEADYIAPNEERRKTMVRQVISRLTTPRFRYYSFSLYLEGSNLYNTPFASLVLDFPRRVSRPCWMLIATVYILYVTWLSGWRRKMEKYKHLDTSLAISRIFLLICALNTFLSMF